VPLDLLRLEGTRPPRHARMFLDLELVEALGRLHAARRREQGRRQEQQQQEEAQQRQEEEEQEGRGGGSSAAACAARVRALLAASFRRAAAVDWTKQGLTEHEPLDAEADPQGAAEEPAGPAADAAEGGEAADAAECGEAAVAAPAAAGAAATPPPPPPPPPPGEQELDTLADALLDCSCVIAMHADAATEPAVRLALLLGRPFAVVPCCVYGAHFPRRRLASGTAVATHADLVQYIQEAAAAAGRRAEAVPLPFEGKNLCITCPALAPAAAAVAAALPAVGTAAAAGPAGAAGAAPRCAAATHP
jgi:hypothetical protein